MVYSIEKTNPIFYFFCMRNRGSHYFLAEGEAVRTRGSSSGWERHRRTNLAARQKKIMGAPVSHATLELLALVTGR